MIRLGFHLSIAGSVANAPKEAEEKGYTDFQIFTTSSRSWKNSKIPEEDSEEFIGIAKENDISAFAHIPYLCNPASPNKEVYSKSKEMLVNNLNNCAQLGIENLVIHLGSHLGKGVDAGIKNICSAVSEVVEETEHVNVLLENSSGYKNSVGSKFEEIGRILEKIDSKRVGVCFDTCHAFAAGYELRTEKGMEKTENDFISAIGRERLKLVHLNDAKFGLGSGLDRHWHIGKGNIGKEGFKAFFKTKTFGSGSFVMETPEDEVADHAIDMKEIKKIISEVKSG